MNEDRAMAEHPPEHPLVTAARRLADGLLAPDAERVDAEGVPASHLAALVDAGMAGMTAPVAAGGAGAPPAVFREVIELLAGADLSTWFVLAQHYTPVARVAAAGRRPDLLAELVSGRALAGVAFAHLRRLPHRAVTATPLAGGAYRLDGEAPWYTGWGLTDVAVVAGATEGGDVVFAALPAREAGGLTAGPPMRLAALSATRTVALALDGVVVPTADVIEVLPAQVWAATDRAVAVNATPMTFGVARRALDLLAAVDQPAARRAAAGLRERLAGVRSTAYGLVDAVPAGRPLAEADVARRLEVRARAGRLAVDAATALVVAGAGRSMLLTSPAQRLLREAAFLLVQAQTAEARAAALDHFGG
jgi:alkylation response protein AidB-like acyl-CoA dehydrogenase